MADDFTFSDFGGTSRTAAADDVGSKLYPWVKMAAGADNTATPAVTTAVNATFTTSGAGAYTANDAVANSATAGSVTPLSWTIAAGAGILRRVRIDLGQTDLTPTFRLWLFEASPTVAAGDNGVFDLEGDDCLGYVDVALSTAGSVVDVGWTNCDIPFQVGTLYGLIQTRTAFTTTTSGKAINVELTYIPG